MEELRLKSLGFLSCGWRIRVLGLWASFSTFKKCSNTISPNPLIKMCPKKTCNLTRRVNPNLTRLNPNFFGFGQFRVLGQKIVFKTLNFRADSGRVKFTRSSWNGLKDRRLTLQITTNISDVLQILTYMLPWKLPSMPPILIFLHSKHTTWEISQQVTRPYFLHSKHPYM